MTTATESNGNGTVTVQAGAGGSKKQSVRMQFLCEKRQLEFKEDIPVSLIGIEAAQKPAMPKMFEMTLSPIVMKHAGEALDACEAKCSSKGCEKDATTVVATPMSVSFLFTLLGLREREPLNVGNTAPLFPVSETPWNA